MATISDSITGDENVNAGYATGLTIATNPSVVASGGHEEKVESFLRRMLPVVSDSATHPVQALVPWVCDVLQSKQSLEVYGQDIRDFTAHMQRFGIQPLEVKADHLRLYKAALRDAGLAGATIARKLSVLRGMYRQFAVKKLIPWEVAQDIAAVESPQVQKNTTPALTEKQAVQLLHAPDTSTLRGLRDKALRHTLFITACRVSAITRTKVGHLEFDGTEWFLNVTEKRCKKQRKILLEAARSIVVYLKAAGIRDDREGPIFRRFSPNGRSLLPVPLCRETVWRIVRHAFTLIELLVVIAIMAILPNSAVRLRDITDGTSMTAMIGERRPTQRPVKSFDGNQVVDVDIVDLTLWIGAIPWSSDANLRTTGTGLVPPNSTDRSFPGFNSAHHGRLFFGLADGSVRSIAPSIDMAVYQALMTRAGGESIGEF